MHARCRSRRTIERLVLLAVAGLVLRTWYVEGLFVPFKVVSGSMAPTLWGVHREVVCVECKHKFACGADVRPVGRRAVCPNCGSADNDLRAQPDIAGDRLLVGKSIFSIRAPRRWEVVAFRHPQRPREIHVKRVVGLPGESIQIRDGEIYVDGKLQRKTLLQQRALAVLVHDANFTATTEPGLPPRWRDDRVGTGWGSAAGRFAHPSVPGMTSIDWLTYRHWRRTPGRPEMTVETPITNERGYNQALAERSENIHSVTDVLLSFRLVRTFGEGQLFVRATDGRDEFEVRIESGAWLYEVYRNGEPLEPSGRGELPEWKGELHVEVSLFDRQFLLAFEGRPAVVYPYEPMCPTFGGQRARGEGRQRGNQARGTSDDRRSPLTPRFFPLTRPLAIGSKSLGVQVQDLRVYRDVYYTHPVGLGGRWGLDEPVRLGANECFVLGDNSPISEDSRTWPDGPAVPLNLLLGKPLLVHFPARRIAVGPWHFQVPDPARIRYIR